MWNQMAHLSDEELLFWVDGELPRRRAVKARVHLSACWACRSRMAQLEKTIHDFMHTYNSSIPKLPSSSGPRALLKARLAELSVRGNDGSQKAGRWALGLWVAAACLLVLVIGGIFLHRHAGGFDPAAAPLGSSLPDPRLTPGATIAADINDLCSTPHDEVVRSVPTDLQEAVLREYGLPPARAQNFEIDFLISPGLGGAESIRNLWPQPRHNTLWNSFVKDQLEDYLHQSVCQGKVSLETAQREIAGDWISAYRKYFHTKQPLAAVSGMPVVRPRNLTGYSRFRAPANLQAPRWGTAKAVALRGPSAHHTNSDPLASYSLHLTTFFSASVLT